MSVLDIASSLGAGASLGGSVGGVIDTSVLKAVENLSAIQASTLFASLGLGTSVDTFA